MRTLWVLVAACVALSCVGCSGTSTLEAQVPELEPAPGGPLVRAAPQLTLAGARIAIAGARAEAERRNTTGTIAVADAAGHLIALARIDGTFIAGDAVSSGKARTAALFRKPTAFFETIIREGRTPMLNIPDFMPMQGGVPIEIEGVIVGAIGASGASSAPEDEELALAGVRALVESPNRNQGRDTQVPPTRRIPAQVTSTDSRFVAGASLTLAGAQSVIAGAVAEARSRNVPGAISVVDASGHLIAFERLDGTFLAGDVVSAGKARTAALFRKPTAVFERIISEGRTPMLNIPDFTPMQGGIPIVVNGMVVGAIGIAGAATAQNDAEIALIGAQVIMGEGSQ